MIKATDNPKLSTIKKKTMCDPPPPLKGGKFTREKDKSKQNYDNEQFIVHEDYACCHKNVV